MIAVRQRESRPYVQTAENDGHWAACLAMSLPVSKQRRL